MKKTIYFIASLSLLAAQPLYPQNLLSLDECKRLALRNNCGIKNSALEIEESKKTKSAAFTKYFPQVSAGVFEFKAKENLMEKSMELPPQFSALLPGGIDFGMLKEGTVGYVNVIQPVYAGGRIYTGNRLASLGVEAGSLKSRLSEDQVLIRTEEQYWQIISLNNKYKTVLKQEELLNALLKQVEDSYNAGLIMKNDVLKVRQNKSETLLNISKLNNGRKIATMAFCQFMGIAYNPDLSFENKITDVKPETLFVNHTEALQNRYEYRLLKKSVEAEELKTKIKMGEYLPQIGVGLTGMYYGFDEDDMRFNGMAFGMIQVPVSDWWGGTYELRARGIREQITENDLKDKTELLLLQMEKARQDLNDAYSQVALSRESEEQAEENLRLTNDSYINGLVNVSDLLEAQTILQNAQSVLSDAEADYRIKQIYYLQATGRSF